MLEITRLRYFLREERFELKIKIGFNHFLVNNCYSMAINYLSIHPDGTHEGEAKWAESKYRKTCQIHARVSSEFMILLQICYDRSCGFDHQSFECSGYVLNPFILFKE